MDKELVLTTIEYVQAELANAEGGHDWFHIERVWKTARTISKTEGGNELVIDLAALLHDIADSKFHGGDDTVGVMKAVNFLSELDVAQEVINHVAAIMENVSFKGGKEARTFESLELDIVQDADRLDALGAIGIARAFNYGGFRNRALYDPSVPPDLEMDKEAYKKSNAPTINHFYEKLLLLKDRMNTDTGRRMAQERHKFMEAYLAQFYKEWEGEA